jgi:hypothetical protein
VFSNVECAETLSSLPENSSCSGPQVHLALLILHPEQSANRSILVVFGNDDKLADSNGGVLHCIGFDYSMVVVYGTAIQSSSYRNEDENRLLAFER